MLKPETTKKILTWSITGIAIVASQLTATWIMSSTKRHKFAKELQDIAHQFPKKVDEMTILNSLVVNDDKLIYSYKLLVDKKDVPDFANKIKMNLEISVCRNEAKPISSMFDIIHTYSDQKGEVIATFQFPKGHCN